MTTCMMLMMMMEGDGIEVEGVFGWDESGLGRCWWICGRTTMM